MGAGKVCLKDSMLTTSRFISNLITAAALAYHCRSLALSSEVLPDVLLSLFLRLRERGESGCWRNKSLARRE